MQNGMISNLLSMMGYSPARLAQEYCSRYGGDANYIQSAIERGDTQALAGMHEKAKQIAAANPSLLNQVKSKFMGGSSL